MSILEFSSLLFVIACFTGIFGVLTGLGGGIVIVPILTAFQVDIHLAMGASLISIITLSLSSSTTQTNQTFANIPVGIFLETAAVMGAITGALLLPYLPIYLIAIVFGLVLQFSILSSVRQPSRVDSQTTQLQPRELSSFQRPQLVKGWFTMGIAGILSGTLGIGSGTLKVLAMDRMLHLPYKVSTATSNFMVGITAAASVGIYYSKGYIDPNLTFPVVLGVFFGALIGTKILKIAKTQHLKKLFLGVIFIISLQMLYKGITGLI